MNELTKTSPWDATKLAQIRADFPLLSRKVNGKDLVYFDNGATAQKPQVVIDALHRYYSEQNANIHRGVHSLSQQITVAYEQARKTIQEHLHAAAPEEIIFTAGTTASINLLATSFGKKFIQSGDIILVSEMEHHSNILPWQQVCEEKGAKLQVIRIHENGELDMDHYRSLLNKQVKMVAVTQISNTLGTVNPIKEMVALAHTHNIPVMVDGAQAVPHCKPDVQELDCDFYCFSGHKIFGPTGVGILYGKEKWLQQLPPYQVGGGTIKTVSFEKTEYADLPLKFEAGTPHIAGGIGLAAAIDYLNTIGMENIAAYEQELLEHATAQLQNIAGVRIIGTAANKASVISFVVENIHPFDLGTLLDQMGIAVRTGHHCTQPLMQRYGIPGTIRASFAFYNTRAEIDSFILALKKAISMLS